MQVDKKKIHAIIFKALHNLNQELDSDRKISVNEHTRLFGTDAVLDSLSLVSVIVDVETEISNDLGRTISLTDDRAMSSEVSPFTDVNSLTDYILTVLAEKE
jgi:acyl carrier protein